jgi:hypothetical protein
MALVSRRPARAVAAHDRARAAPARRRLLRACSPRSATQLPMIRSVREPSSLTSQRPPPQTPLAMTSPDRGPTPGQARYRREERPGRLRPEHHHHRRRITIR